MLFVAFLLNDELLTYTLSNLQVAIYVGEQAHFTVWGDLLIIIIIIIMNINPAKLARYCHEV